MSVRQVAWAVALLGVVGWAACRFDPDLSRFQECNDDGACPTGYTCLEESRLCLPDCGAQGPCETEEPPDAATDAGGEDGGDLDAGSDAGSDAGLDAGPDAGPDAGLDAGVDAGPPLSLLTESLPAAVETVPYTQEFQVEGGTPPYVFLATEALPAGLMLDGGVLMGTPPVGTGTFRVAVEIQDQASPPGSVSRVYDLKIRPLLRVAGPSILANAYLNNAYTETISATGGTPPYQFAIEPGGRLPTGLTLQTDGGVSGTPTESGERPFQVRVTDSDPLPQSVTRPLTVSAGAVPLLTAELSTQAVPDGRVGTPYHYVLRIIGNANPTWKLEAGTTPAGIGFDAATGTLLGTPLAPGVSSFTISATGALNKVERTFTLTVY